MKNTMTGKHASRPATADHTPEQRGADAGEPLSMAGIGASIGGREVVGGDEAVRRIAELELELSQAREFAENVIGAVREPLLVLDERMRVESANEAFYRTFGVGAAETLGELLFDLGNGQWDIPRLRELLERVLPQETHVEAFRVEHDFEHLGRRTMLLNARRILDPQRKPRRIMLAVEDVTDRERAEGERAWVASIVESSGDAIVTKDLNGIIQTWNPGAERIFGYTAEEAIGQPINMLIPPDHKDEEPHILACIRRGERVGHYETVRRRKDGKLVDISLMVSPVLDAQGRVARASKIARDITERVRAEEAVRESEERYRTLFTSMDQGFCVIEMLFDGDGKPADYRFLEVNPAFEKHTGLHDAAGKRMLELAPSHEAHWFDIYGEVALTGEPRRFVNEAQSLDDRWFDAYAFRLGGLESRKVAILFSDITAQNRMEREIAEQAKALADMNRRKDEFLAMLSHELRNPMSAISSALQLVRPEPGENEPQREARRVIERQLRHMSRLTDDLLEVSRITTGRIRLRIDRVNLNSVIERAVERMRPLVERRGQRLAVAVAAGGAVWLDADSSRLEQVLDNLLDNASKYSPHGGRIALSVEAGDREAAVRVRDAGDGIAAEVLPHVFDLFSQADQSLHHASGGLGLGLALVKRLVELHGGTVGARSEGIGQGSEFEVRLPLASPPARSADAAATRPDAAGQESHLRILIVDDHPDVAKMSAMLLRSWGHDVRVADDGPGALQQATGFQPHVILLDIGLPGMDGFEVARLIRQHATLQDVRIVALTGYGQDTDRQRSKEAGFDHHLIKPVEAADLQELLAGYVPPT